MSVPSGTASSAVGQSETATTSPPSSTASAPVPPAERWAIGQQVVARYAFAGTAPEDLPFKRKDVLTIVRQTKDPMWYRAKNDDGQEGMIPATYVRLKDDFNSSLKRGKNEQAIPGAKLAAGPPATPSTNGVTSPNSSSSATSDVGGVPGNVAAAGVGTNPQFNQAGAIDSNPNGQERLTMTESDQNNFSSAAGTAAAAAVAINSAPSAATANSNHNGKSDSTANDPNGEKREVKMESMAWFHGKISRDDAETLLLGNGVGSQAHPDGTYLIRESTYFPGDYTLCLLFEDKVEHYHILYKENRLTIDEEVFFENLSQLVRHYQNDADGLVTNLQTFVSKSGGLDFDVKVSEFYDAGWVIPKNEVELSSKLGKGEFGDVWEGHYKNSTVAIKCLKDDARAQKILKEASIMTSLRHPNLVSLQGVVLSPEDGIVWLVTEFMAKGSLVDFLRSRGRPLISKKNQICFACDTCEAMMYLEERHIIHRDLAARNVLLSDVAQPDGQLVAKVSDFGLARPDDYSIEGGKFPIKWTAPEALRYSKFSNKSDMWSFGVLLWEIYSFGRTPYPRIPIVDVVKHVERGYRMEAPEGCPERVYELMREAWKLEPESRPSFADVLKPLREINANTPN